MNERWVEFPCERCGEQTVFEVRGDAVDLTSGAWGDDVLRTLCWKCSGELRNWIDTEKAT